MIGPDKNGYDVRIAFQHGICASADDDAGFLICQLSDDLGLHIKQHVVHGKPEAGHFIGVIRGYGIEPGICPLFIHGLEMLHADTAFFGSQLDQPAVIAFDTQLLCRELADFMAAAAKLPADCNNCVCHIKAPFLLIANAPSLPATVGLTELLPLPFLTLIVPQKGGFEKGIRTI